MAVHSKDGQTWLTKLERIGELSARNKDMVFNNIGHLINADMLKVQYHLLSGSKAIGIDKVTKSFYGEKLDERINDLINRIRRGTYKPKPARITEIPKEDGSKRPLAISCFEDKLIQLAVSTILSKIYEPLFLPCSFGFRPSQSCHDALRALNQVTFKNWSGSLIEIDIRKYFNTIPHSGLMEILRKKISDKRFLRLIDVLITMPIIENKTVKPNSIGCPQGSIISSTLANIYLHHVIDSWFEEIKPNHFRGRAETIRYADDMVFTFSDPRDAERFYSVLPKRLNKYGLEMHIDKSQMISAGHLNAVKAERNGKRLPTFNFLGFTCYWGKSKRGYWCLKYTSRRDRFSSKLRSMKQFLNENLNVEDTQELLKHVISGIKGWINYHCVSDNKRRVNQFLQISRWLIFRWFNRRGGKKRMTEKRLDELLKAVNFPTSWKTISMYHAR
ncbi:MAG: reverse transcriptase domain-containing protein [Gammaproteobacteria bacterium]